MCVWECVCVCVCVFVFVFASLVAYRYELIKELIFFLIIYDI